MKCKNCDFEFDGKFCPHCGQNSDVKRFDYSYFIRETFFSSLDIEQGFFSSVKDLTLRPGNVIREYLAGKRLSLAVPGKYLLIMGALSTFLAVQFEVFKVPEISMLFMWLPMVEEFFKFATQYATITNIITIPIFAFFSWVIFYDRGFNYTENTILAIYITSQQLLFLIVMVPILSIFDTINSELIACYTIITIIYNIWVYLQFFKLKLVPGILLSIVSIALSYVVQFFFNYAIYRVLPQKLAEILS